MVYKLTSFLLEQQTKNCERRNHVDVWHIMVRKIKITNFESTRLGWSWHENWEKNEGSRWKVNGYREHRSSWKVSCASIAILNVNHRVFLGN